MSEDSAAVPAPESPPEARSAVAQEAGAAPAVVTGATPGVGGTPAFVASAAPEPPSAADPTPTKPERRRLRWLWWTAGSVFVASLAGLSAYLVVVAHQWSGRVDDLTAISRDLGTQVADQTAARQAADAKAATLQSQLDTSKARITDLANQEANAVDHEAVWINLVDSLISCADERQRVVDAYTQGLGFEGISRAGYAAEITTYCEGLKTEYTNYKAEIGK